MCKTFSGRGDKNTELFKMWAISEKSLQQKKCKRQHKVMSRSQCDRSVTNTKAILRGGKGAPKHMRNETKRTANFCCLFPFSVKNGNILDQNDLCANL